MKLVSAQLCGLLAALIVSTQADYTKTHSQSLSSSKTHTKEFTVTLPGLSDRPPVIEGRDPPFELADLKVTGAEVYPDTWDVVLKEVTSYGEGGKIIFEATRTDDTGAVGWGQTPTFYYNVVQETDECAPEPCKNNAVCVDGWNEYTCNCADGYSGDNCETNIDECVDNGCLNGAACVDGVGTYTCECADGYTGDKCETKTDATTIKVISKGFDLGPDAQFFVNGEEVIDTFRGYNIMLMDPVTKAITSKKFDTWGDAPTQIPLMNKYIDDIPFGSIVAVAVRDAQYVKGRDLTTSIEGSRRGLESLGGGRDGCPFGVFRDAFALITMKVENLDDLPPWFTCELKATNTESAIVSAVIPTDNCIDNGCLNGAACVDGVGTYTCECADGYTGDKCETNIDDCVGNGCLNGAACVDGPIVGQYTCKCVDGYTGEKCGTAPKPIVPRTIPEPVVPVIPTLMCYECQSGISNQHCIRTGRLAKCQTNQGSCQNTVRINNGRLQIMKGCKQTQACESNMRQNSVVGKVDASMRKWGVHTQCSFSWQQTTCRCCCSTDRCNSRPLYCATDKAQNAVAKYDKGSTVLKAVTKQPQLGERIALRDHPCFYNPCGNGAECIREEGEKYSCKCQPGWRDSHCNTPSSRRNRARVALSKARSGFLHLFGQ